jgi:hypothetical protein
LRADPITLSLLAGLASLVAVFLRRTADSAVASASSALRKALYVEITVVEADDARLYKALVRWLTERGMLDRVNRYKAVSTALRDASTEGKRGSSSGGSGVGTHRHVEPLRSPTITPAAVNVAPFASFHATSSIELLPSATLETHRFTFKGSWAWAKIGGGTAEDDAAVGLTMIGSLRSGVAARLARRTAKRNAQSPYICLSALQGHTRSGGGGLAMLKQLLQEALDEAARADHRYVEVYELVTPLHDSARWDLSALARKRPPTSVVLEGGFMEGLIADVGQFISDEDWHISHNVPHRHGILLHGPPGNGKSSVVMALASHFSLPVAIVPLARLDANTTIGEVFSSAPPCSVLVLEDIDAVFSHGVLKRDLHRPADTPASGGSVANATGRGGSTSASAPSSSPSSFAAAFPSGGAASLSELLNALDGVGAQAGRLVVMTTNALDKLDDALIRPGRCDRVVELKNANADMAARLFASFFHELPNQALVAELAPLFGAAAAGDQRARSMASLQGLLLRTRGDPQAALDEATRGRF